MQYTNDASNKLKIVSSRAVARQLDVNVQMAMPSVSVALVRGYELLAVGGLESESAAAKENEPPR